MGRRSRRVAGSRPEVEPSAKPAHVRLHVSYSRMSGAVTSGTNPSLFDPPETWRSLREADDIAEREDCMFATYCGGGDMTSKLVAMVLLCLMSGTAMAQEPKVAALMSKDLTEDPGSTVEHAPGGASAIHRHNAHAFVYVLEGSQSGQGFVAQASLTQ